MSMDSPKIEEIAQKSVDQLASEYKEFFVVKKDILYCVKNGDQVELIDWVDSSYDDIAAAIQSSVVLHKLEYKHQLGQKILSLLLDQQ